MSADKGDWSEVKSFEELSGVLVERKRQHGDFQQQFECCQAIKRVLREYNYHQTDVGQITNLTSPVMWESLSQIAHKLSRIVTGNPNHSDHWRDIAGYATLITNMLEGK